MQKQVAIEEVLNNGLERNVKKASSLKFLTYGYRKPFNTLKESEEYLKYIKDTDPLCYKDFPYERGFYKNQESYDDRAYIRFEI